MRYSATAGIYLLQSMLACALPAPQSPPGTDAVPAAPAQKTDWLDWSGLVAGTLGVASSVVTAVTTRAQLAKQDLKHKAEIRRTRRFARKLISFGRRSHRKTDMALQQQAQDIRLLNNKMDAAADEIRQTNKRLGNVSSRVQAAGTKLDTVADATKGLRYDVDDMRRAGGLERETLEFSDQSGDNKLSLANYPDLEECLRNTPFWLELGALKGCEEHLTRNHLTLSHFNRYTHVRSAIVPAAAAAAPATPQDKQDKRAFSIQRSSGKGPSVLGWQMHMPARRVWQQEAMRALSSAGVPLPGMPGLTGASSARSTGFRMPSRIGKP